jgi:hypothetical protein
MFLSDETWVFLVDNGILVAVKDCAFVTIGPELEFHQKTKCRLVLSTVYGVDMGSTLGPPMAKISCSLV